MPDRCGHGLLKTPNGVVCPYCGVNVDKEARTVEYALDVEHERAERFKRALQEIVSTSRTIGQARRKASDVLGGRERQRG